MFQLPLVLRTDSYKLSHFLQLPDGITKDFEYIESRGGIHDEVLFFGLQYSIMKHLLTPVTTADIALAQVFAMKHGLPFNFAGWDYIVKKHGGLLPLRIRAVKEGTIVPTHNVLVTVENTDPLLPWLPGYIETLLLRAVWYPTTVASISWHAKQTILKYLQATSEDPNGEIDFKLHDFGARGTTCSEQAELGGAAHLVNFRGSDTMEGAWTANQYYDHDMAAFSIPAAQHGTIMSWGKDRESAAYRNMLDKFAKRNAVGPAVVSDTYDFWNAMENIWGEELRQAVVDTGALVVLRPDSGHPPTVVLRALKILYQKFGGYTNSRGYIVLNHVRLIQGDGMDLMMIDEVLEVITKAGFSATNLAFGMGAGLLQKCDRDTYKFAQKASWVEVNNIGQDIFKDPVTDPGKRSKAGRVDLVKKDGMFMTVPYDAGTMSQLDTVFENGRLLRIQTLEEIRALSREVYNRPRPVLV